jgi:hypothetical protein
VLWTANDEYARAVAADGLPVYRGNPLEDATSGTPSGLEGIELALMVGDDENLCAMAATDLAEYFGRDRVFQLAVSEGPAADFLTRVPVLFDNSASHDALLTRIKGGAKIAVAARATGENAQAAVQDRPVVSGMPMFVLTPGKTLRVLVAGDEPELETGQVLISLSES